MLKIIIILFETVAGLFLGALIMKIVLDFFNKDK